MSDKAGYLGAIVFVVLGAWKAIELWRVFVERLFRRLRRRPVIRKESVTE